MNALFEIENFLPALKELNNNYREIIKTKEIIYRQQAFITQFYQAYNNLYSFHEMIIKLYKEIDKEKFIELAGDTQNELSRNIAFYTSNESLLNHLDISKIFDWKMSFFESTIKLQAENVREYSTEQTELKNSYENASWNGDIEKQKNLERHIDIITAKYKKEKEKLEKLIDERREKEKQFAPYSTNLFHPIHQLNLQFFESLQNYTETVFKKESVIEKETATKVIIDKKQVPVKLTDINNVDEIFMPYMYDRLLNLEKKLIKNKDLSADLHWLPTHKNGKADIKRLVTFLSALVENNYFLPNRDKKIKTFFENRYHISIGQNFEKSRREKIITQNKMIFSDYRF